MNGLPLAPPIGPVSTSPATDSAARPLAGGQVENLSLMDRIAVLEHVLSMLDTLTAAGQRHMMKRIATFVQQQAASAAGRLGDRTLRELLELVVALDRAGEMGAPDVGAFTVRAKSAFARLLA